jgi:hypothetical protein
MMPRSRAALAVILVAVVSAVLVPLTLSRGGAGELVSAQIPPGPVPTPVPTAPCPGCGPNPGKPGVSDFAWSYPLHFCPPDDPTSSAVYAIVYGNGAGSAVPVTFFARIEDNVRQLDTLAPGERGIENPAITVGQGITFNLEMWATTDGTETGPRVRFGNGQTQRFDTLTCDCPISRQVTTTTTVTTTGTSITVTTRPGETPSTAPRQLPASQ